MKAKEIIEGKKRELAELPPRKPAALLFPRDPAERRAENERRLALWKARERVAEEGIAAIKAAIPQYWPRWEWPGGADKEIEFAALAAWVEKLAAIHAK